MTLLFMLKGIVWLLIFPANWGDGSSVVKLLSNVTISVMSIGFAIADSANGDGAPIGWLLCAMLYAYSSGDQYWKLFHDAADQESKWAWREWREREYEKKRQRELPVLQLFSGEIPAEGHEPKGTLIAEQQLPRDWLSVEGIGFSVATKPNKGTIH